MQYLLHVRYETDMKTGGFLLPRNKPYKAYICRR